MTTKDNPLTSEERAQIERFSNEFYRQRNDLDNEYLRHPDNRVAWGLVWMVSAIELAIGAIHWFIHH